MLISTKHSAAEADGNVIHLIKTKVATTSNMDDRRHNKIIEKLETGITEIVYIKGQRWAHMQHHSYADLLFPN